MKEAFLSLFWLDAMIPQMLNATILLVLVIPLESIPTWVLLNQIPVELTIV